MNTKALTQIKKAIGSLQGEDSSIEKKFDKLIEVLDLGPR
jgi:hypothetical protein